MLGHVPGSGSQDGGWHHANHATPLFFPKTGYCFVNDIVLPIQRLSNNFKQVLYVDVHHSDGMEKTFAAIDRVLTPARHARFFLIRNREIGRRGQWKDDMYKAFAKKALLVVREKFEPDTVVFQAGSEGFERRPHESFKLYPNQFDISTQVRTSDIGNPHIGAWRRRYHEMNVAKCRMTAAIAGLKLDGVIPEHKYLPT